VGLREVRMCTHLVLIDKLLAGDTAGASLSGINYPAVDFQ
jgi:hypothetical protein